MKWLPTFYSWTKAALHDSQSKAIGFFGFPFLLNWDFHSNSCFPTLGWGLGDKPNNWWAMAFTQVHKQKQGSDQRGVIDM